MKSTLCLLLASLMTSTATAATPPVPPDVEKRPHVVKAPFGATRNDDYYWLRDDKREDKAMLAYLQAENAYADQLLAPLKPLEDALYGEIVGRIKQDDASVPARERGYWYYSRYETGQDYPIHARRKASMDAPEEVLLNVNTMAAGKGYFSVGSMEVSQDNQLLAWADDDVGRRQYVIRFKDLRTGAVLPDTITGTSGDLVWADDNRTVLYVENDPETLLTVRVKKHVLGTRPAPTPSSTKKRTTASTWASAAPATIASSPSACTAPCPPKSATRRPATRPRSPCSPRASATWSTTPTTTMAAG